MNNVSLLGRTTNEIELKTTQSGKSVVSFSLAVKRKFSKDKTDFINCIAWDKTAEFLSKYIRKGQMIAVDGNIQTRSYTTNNGEKRSATEVLVENVYFTGDKQNADTGAQRASRDNNYTMADDNFTDVDETDDLPF